MSRDIAQDQILSPERDTTRGLLDIALEISTRRRDTLARLRAALLRDDINEVVLYARELCGLDDDETGNRTDQGVH
jgi:hypothetical protein